MDAIAAVRGVERMAAARYGRELLPLAFLAEARRDGIPGALVTIVGIDGGTPRPLGAHMAVLSDGRHVGHLSGGCVEPAIAAEVAPILAAGTDQIIRFGKGSCYIDIQFPCGGGVDLLVHTSPSPQLLIDALGRADRREPFTITFDPANSRSEIVHGGTITGWQGDYFLRRHLPRTRLVLVGRGPDFEVMARVAAAAEFELCLATPDISSMDALADLDVAIEHLKAPHQPLRSSIDEWTAVVLLFHQREWEGALLANAAAGPCFYLGALGSQRTHRLRREHLAAMGVSARNIDRIRGPIGLVDRARDPGALALSVLAEISAAWALLERA
jgi:xanthine dehydrogenase accessory factor